MSFFRDQEYRKLSLNLGNIDFGDKSDLFQGNKETKRFISEKQANESPK